MKTIFNFWTNPRDNSIRAYINDPRRKTVYFCADANGKTTWSSKAADTPHKFQTGDHYGKVRKDQDAAHEFAKENGIVLGETPFSTITNTKVA